MTGPSSQVALAKLTLSLRVTGVRADGYHLLDAEMVTLDLADELTFSDGDGLELAGRLRGVPRGEDNLVFRALAALGYRAHVSLHKRIPAAAGLGGGSADAAAVLRWAQCDDQRVAASLGADVPFCLVGGHARVRGIGDDIEPLPFVAGVPYTMLIPPFGVSTAEVYRRWDLMGGPTGSGPNDLEVAARAVEPRLVRWRDRLGDATGVPPILAGSGATWFVPGEFPEVQGAIVARTARH